MTNRTKIASGINLVAGLWLMFSSVMMDFGMYGNLFIVGTIVAILSVTELLTMEGGSWLGWINGVLGFWLLISPLALTMATAGEIWNSVILGLIILVSALWGAMSSASSMGHGHPKMG